MKTKRKRLDLDVAKTRILPDGDIIGWKKCRNNKYGRMVIVKLLIPAKARRSHAYGRKCRASYAIVLSVFGAKVGISWRNRRFKYIRGKTVRPTLRFDTDWAKECASGIHFFITREEAEAYWTG